MEILKAIGYGEDQPKPLQEVKKDTNVKKNGLHLAYQFKFSDCLEFMVLADQPLKQLQRIKSKLFLKRTKYFQGCMFRILLMQYYSCYKIAID